jgi:hydroxymethylglutaryl-CoA synthase
LGFTTEQIATGLLAGEIGNTYAGSAMIGATAVLDVAKPNDRILFVSFGSGAGSDAFSFVVTEKIVARQGRAPSTRQYIARRKPIDYALYAKYREKYVLN